jgi:hypothetical protein
MGSNGSESSPSPVALQRLADYRIIDNNIDVKDIQHVRRCLVRPMSTFSMKDGGGLNLLRAAKVRG